MPQQPHATQSAPRDPHELDPTRRMRQGVYAVLILLSIGQLSGKLAAVNSIDMASAEKSFREELRTELKFLALTAAETNSPHAELYSQTLLDEFGIKADSLIKDEKDIRASRSKASRRWPIESRRANWGKRNKPYDERELLKTVLAESRKQRPFLSGNDRSRWLTVRALVEHGTYAVDDVFQEPGWDSIDLVAHKDADGVQHLYSSKPPLMATLMAGEYWVLHKLTGWTLGDHPYELGRFMLFTLNIIPLAGAWWVATMLIDEWGTTDFGRIAAVAALCFCTMLNPFAVSLTNHLWGAIAAIFLSYDATRIWRGDLRLRFFIGAGIWSAFLVANELPALCLAAGLFGLFVYRYPRSTLIAFVPAAVVVAVAFFGTNYVAHGTLESAYSHGMGYVSPEDAAREPELGDPDNWYNYKFVRELDGPVKYSYWRKPDNPVDLGEASIGLYVFHAFIGHHGIFSLTPILLLAVPGLYFFARSTDDDRRNWARLVIGVSLICLAFYLLYLDQRQRNYGGPISALRQMLWMQPLWIIAALPILDRATDCRKVQIVVGVLMLFSALSTTYPTWNPWTQNWIWNAMTALGIPTMS